MEHPKENARGANTLVICITPCLLGFSVVTYWAYVRDDDTISHGCGFSRVQGIYTAHDLINSLIWTEEPFTVRICPTVPRVP